MYRYCTPMVLCAPRSLQQRAAEVQEQSVRRVRPGRHKDHKNPKGNAPPVSEGVGHSTARARHRCDFGLSNYSRVYGYYKLGSARAPPRGAGRCPGAKSPETVPRSSLTLNRKVAPDTATTNPNRQSRRTLCTPEGESTLRRGSPSLRGTDLVRRQSSSVE